jgi:pantothenate kinase
MAQLIDVIAACTDDAQRVKRLKQARLSEGYTLHQDTSGFIIRDAGRVVARASTIADVVEYLEPREPARSPAVPGAGVRETKFRR